MPDREVRNSPLRMKFLKALSELHSGRIPDTMPFVAAHISNTTKELMEYSEAITECALRLNNNNKVLRDMANSYQALALRSIGKNVPLPIKNCKELIDWLNKSILKSQEEGKAKSAEMLGSALDAVLLLVSTGKGKVEE